MSRETILEGALEEVSSSYNYILSDCPPLTRLLTLNALAALPVSWCRYKAAYALEGLTTADTINLVKRHLNPQIGIFDVVITMFDGRTQLTRQVTQRIFLVKKCSRLYTEKYSSCKRESWKDDCGV